MCVHNGTLKNLPLKGHVCSCVKDLFTYMADRIALVKLSIQQYIYHVPNPMNKLCLR